MKMLLGIILSFILGFFVHMYFFGSGNVTSIDINEVANAAKIKDKIIPQGTSAPNPWDVRIEYDGTKFSSSTVYIETARYLTIANVAKNGNQMWLESDYKELNTVRGYTNQEAKTIRMDRPGKYYIRNKLNLNAKATIQVGK